MIKKQYQKPSFISKSGKNINVAPGALAAAAGAAVATHLKQKYGSNINEDTMFSLAPVRRVGV